MSLEINQKAHISLGSFPSCAGGSLREQHYNIHEKQVYTLHCGIRLLSK